MSSAPGGRPLDIQYLVIKAGSVDLTNKSLIQERRIEDLEKSVIVHEKWAGSIFGSCRIQEEVRCDNGMQFGIFLKHHYRFLNYNIFTNFH